MKTYEQADEGGARTPGWNCENCGQPGFEHDRVQDVHEDGRRSYRLECPA